MEKKKFALIGYPIGHSFSPFIHHALFEVLGLDASYTLEDFPVENLEKEIPRLFRTYSGFNCTIPYKERIIPYLQSIDEKAISCQAVNTVFEEKGYNTDVAGFLASNLPLKGQRILILGSGGAGKMLLSTLAEEGASEIFIRVRKKEGINEYLGKIREKFPRLHCQILLEEELHQLEAVDGIINASPLGMWPKLRSLPLAESTYERLLSSGKIQFVMDMVYNPIATKFLLKASSYGIRTVSGLDMLFYQALEAEKIWFPTKASIFEEEQSLRAFENIRKNLAIELRKSFPQKILFTGFMASGKTTLAKALAEEFSSEFTYYDLDERIVANEDGMSIPLIFREKGEGYFRAKEKEILQTLLEKEESSIISLGGGSIFFDTFPKLLEASKAQVIYLDLPLEKSIARAKATGIHTRPMLEMDCKKLVTLYEKRKKVYEEVADLQLDASKPIEELLSSIQRAFYLGEV